MSTIVPFQPRRRTPEQLPADRRLAALVAGYLSGYRGHTRRAYAGDIRDWFAWIATADVEPLAAQRAHVQLYARWLEERAGRKQSTIARKLSSVAGLYRYALEEGWIDRSPAAHVRRPHVSDESPRLGLDRDELSHVLDQAESAGTLEHALICLLGLNGLRVSEVCDADAADLDTQRGHRTLAITRKGGKKAVAPMAPPTAAAIDAHLAGRQLGPLLLSSRGARLSSRQAARIVARVAKAAGIRKTISPHSLRHTFCTLSLDAGVSLRDVQDAMGHADPRTTRRYDRARMNLDRHATYKLASYLAA